MIIVTAGTLYTDIDAYASCVALAELLNLAGETAKAVSTAPLNESVTTSLRRLGAQLETAHREAYDDRFILVDVSDPTQFDPIVDERKVIEIIDHHPGFESYWDERLGANSHIEFIGAAATLVYEQWHARRLRDRMSNTTAQLLAAAILDNTLYFRARVTTERDKAAYRFLADQAGIDTTWATRYFTECQTTIMGDLASALANDTKILTFPGLSDQICIGQLVIWDAQSIINGKLHIVSSLLRNIRSDWLANIVDISGGHSYFVADNDQVKRWAHELLQADFTGDLAKVDRLWLRKEIMKKGEVPARTT